jgi:hypothetical protein
MSSVIISGASTGANVGMAAGTAVGKSLTPQADVHHSYQSEPFGFIIPDRPSAEESLGSQETRSLAQEIKQHEKRVRSRKATSHRISTQS